MMALREQVNKLLKHPTVENLQRRFDQMPKRDRRALIVLGSAIIVLFLYALIWMPIADFRADAREDARRAEQMLGEIQSRESRARAAAAAGQTRQAADLGGRDFLTTVTNSAQQAGLALQRFEPSGSDAIRVWLEKVPFTDLTQWVEHLESEYGIRVDQASIERSGDPGRVTARMMLEL